MPDWRSEIRRRIEPLGLDPHRAAEIVEELTGHLEDRFQEALATGLDPEVAEGQIRTEHLSAAALTEALAAVEPRPARRAPALGETSGRWLSGLGSDLHFALRSLRRSPGLVAVALLTVGLGVGINTAIFSVVNAALFRPLPFEQPDRLVSFWGTAPDKGLPRVSYPDAFYQGHSRLPSLTGVAYYTSGGANLATKAGPDRLTMGWVTPSFFELLGAHPIRGRAFRSEDALPNQPKVVVLSHRYWQRRYGEDPAAVGETLVIDGATFTVIGIMPRGFDFPARSDAWAPLQLDPQSLGCWCYEAVGRLRPGATAVDLAADADRTSYQFWLDREPNGKHDPPNPDRPGTIVKSLGSDLVGDLRTPLLIILAAVGVVLLIGSANLANLLLARATARAREIAVRSALGASPARIARQLLIESGLLSIGGALLGLALAGLAIGGLSRFAVARLSYIQSVEIDLSVAGFAIGLGIVTAIVFGVAPALSGARASLALALREGSRGTGDGATRRLHDAFVVAQLALSLVLVTGAGLLIKSFSRLMAQDLGFDRTVVSARVAPTGPAYSEPAGFSRVTERIHQAIASIPGVESAGLSTTAPFGAGNNQQELVVQGQEPAANQDFPVASVRRVTPRYFETVGTPLMEGRTFEPTDRDSALPVVIVDQTLAHRYWPNGGAIGRRIATGSVRNPYWRTIVGVVANIKHQRLNGPADMYVYQPIAQSPGWSLDLVVRSSLPLAALTTALQEAVRSVDPELPLYQIQTLAHAVDLSLEATRLTNELMVTFAGAALLLAIIGIYGVMSRAVAARVREFGVRLALGASPSTVQRLVLSSGARLTAIGLVLGVVGALLSARLIRGILFQVAPLDPVVLVGSGALLAIVAMAACYLPARQATRVDPIEALRSD